MHRPDPDAPSPPPRTALAFGVLALACAGCLLPFADKAFHIDDPLFLWAARQIQRRPLDFYGFEVNWYGWDMPMADVMKNPPLASYYLALAAAVAGWSEPALHLALLPAAFGVVWGSYRLAEGLCSRPLAAALATLLTPALLVSSTNVMCDTLTLFFWVWAVVWWRRGLERNSGVALAGAAVLVALCALTKYVGVCLLPLLPAYALARPLTAGQPWRTTAKALAALTIPAAVLVAYQLLTKAAYGHGLLLDAADYAGRGRNPLAYTWDGMIAALAFLGGGVCTALCYTPLLWTARQILAGLAATAGLAALDFLFAGTLSINYGYSSPVMWQFLPLAAAGGAVVVLAALDLCQSRDAPALLLFLWVTGIWVFAGALNWTVNVRSLLPLLPAASLLLMRRLDRRFGPARSPLDWRRAWPLAPAAAIAVLVAWADCRLADSERAAADALAVRTSDNPGRLYFTGHWGFQYYMQRHGALPLQRMNPDARRNDLIVLPGNNTNIRWKDGDRYQDVPDREPPPEVPCAWLATMDLRLGAGFYAFSWGPLPFAFGRASPERYRVLRLITPLPQEGQGRGGGGRALGP